MKSAVGRSDSSRLKSGVFLAAVILLCGGCSIREDEGKRTDHTRFPGVAAILYQGYSTGERGGRFVSAFVGEGPETFNAALADDANSVHLARLMNASLVRRNQMSLEWEPYLAGSWAFSNDRRHITFYLREGLRWSDGEPMGADDWEFASRVASTPGIRGNYPQKFYTEAGSARFISIDDLTVRLELPAPYSGAFEIAAVFPLPAHILGPVLALGAEAFNAHWGAGCEVASVVSSGPFVVSAYDPGDTLVMKPNPHYFRTDSAGVQLPYLDEYLIRFAKDRDEAEGMFYSGIVDHFLLRSEEIGPALLMKESLEIELYDAGPDTETLFLAFNQNPAAVSEGSDIKKHKLAWFANRDFRRALCHLVDREAIIEKAASGYGYPAVTFLPGYSPYYWEGADDVAGEYDPDKAKKLLHRAGFRDRDGNGIREDTEGNEVRLVLRTNEENSIRRDICELFAAQAQEAGIGISCVFEPFNKLVTRLVSSYDWELVLIGVSGAIDPVDQGTVFLSSGSRHLIEPFGEYPRRNWEAQLDAAWKDVVDAYDEGLKKRAYERVQRIWIAQAPWVYTYSPAVVHAFKRRWENIFPRSAEGYGLCAVLPRIYARRAE